MNQSENAAIKAGRAMFDNDLYEWQDKSSAVTDLLSDLMHFCHWNNIDFASRLRMAEIHFSDEGTTKS